MLLQVLPLIHRLVRKRVSPKSGVYEDWIQQCALRVMADGVRTFDPGKGAWTTWTAQWVRAAISDMARKEARRPLLQASSDLFDTEMESDIRIGKDHSFRGALMRMPAMFPTPERIASAREELNMAIGAAGHTALSPRDRSIINERAQGWTLVSIGRRHHLSRERVRQILARCRRNSRIAA